VGQLAVHVHHPVAALFGQGHACARITGKRLRCAQGSCIRVNLGTEWDYKLTKKDAGHRLRVRVVAWNGFGHTTSTSKPTRVVKK